MPDFLYLNGYGGYVYASVFAALVPMTVYAFFVYKGYKRVASRVRSSESCHD